jgi:ATP-dependent Clp protease ATP-binding subunit ClpB
MEKHTVSRLVGAPPGYVGYEEGGQLTEAVRRRPYSVILFDEIEKAHQDVFNILLQLLDDGRLTDGQGRTVDFKNTVVIMTSNIASQLILSFKGQNYDRMKEEALEVLRKSFRPEFLNRVDEIVVFHPLTKEQLRQIVDIQLTVLRKRLEERKIELELTDKARDYFADHGYDPNYGARPLRRLIQRELETSLGRKLITGEIRDGSHVVVDAGARGLEFTTREPQNAAA